MPSSSIARALVTLACALVFAVVCAAPADAQARMTVTVRGMTPDAIIQLLKNAGKSGPSASATATVGRDGTANLDLDLGNSGNVQGDARIEVYIEDCDTNPPSKKLIFIDAGTEPPPDNCRNRRRIGGFWFNRTRHITVQGDKISKGNVLTNRWTLIGGGAAAGAVIIGTAVAGDDPIATNGTYIVTITISSDANGHAPFVLYQLITQLVVSGTGGTATITGNSVWQTLTASVSNSVLTFDGTGAVAGRTGVRIRGTLTITSTGAISGTIVLGEPVGASTVPTLPVGSITYTVSGQRN
jgi:hypothetical protein